MTTLAGALRDIAAEMEDAQYPFAVVGGLAISARAEPRLTRDADLAVAVVSDRQAEAIVERLQRRGYRLVAAVEEQAAGRLATARLSKGPAAGIVVDLLFASSGIESEIVATAEHLEVLPGIVLPVATAGYLIAMKLLARDDRRRPMDADDLGALRSVATEEDWVAAGEAVRLIMRRGYGRGRDLAALLDVLRADGAY